MNTTNDNRLKAAAELGDMNLLYTLIQEDPHVLQHIDVTPFVDTPLHVAASAGHLQFATEVMRLKPSLSFRLNPQGFNPIHLAIQHGHNRMVLRFVDVNEELVRVKGREGVTPLHLVSQTGEVDLLANFLLACPESIEDVTVRGETALHVPVRAEQHEALQVLVGWLQRTRQSGAMRLEETILNWKDEAGNTVLHVSTLLNDSQALQLLLKTKIDLKGKNLENSTALDLATTPEIKSILVRAGAKRGSSVTGAPSLPDKLRSNITVVDKIIVFILRIRRDMSDSEDKRSAFLVVAALIATATYQSALSPPGGVYQANAGPPNDNQNIIATLNSTTTNMQGTSVIPNGDFLTLLIFNALSIIVSTTIICILTPSGIVGYILFTPKFLFAFCYLYSMKVISPTSSSSTLCSLIIVSIFCFLYLVVPRTFSFRYNRLERYAPRGEIKKRGGAGGNRW